MRSREILILVTALLLMGAKADGQQPKPTPPSLDIAGYRVAIGTPIEQLNRQLGSVFTADFTAPNTWIYRLNGDSRVTVDLTNGRVSRIVKHFRFGDDTKSVAQVHVEAIKLATMEFGELTKGSRCSPPDVWDFEENDERPVVEILCGPYALRYAFSLYLRDGDASSLDERLWTHPYIILSSR